MTFGPNTQSVFNLTQPRYSALVVELACVKTLGISSWLFAMETAELQGNFNVVFLIALFPLRQ